MQSPNTKHKNSLSEKTLVFFFMLRNEYCGLYVFGMLLSRIVPLRRRLAVEYERKRLALAQATRDGPDPFEMGLAPGMLGCCRLGISIELLVAGGACIDLDCTI